MVRENLTLIFIILFVGLCETFGTVEIDNVTKGLIGRWEFDDGTGRDITEDGTESQAIPSVSKKVIIEELSKPQTKKQNTEPKSFLDKLIADEEN